MANNNLREYWKGVRAQGAELDPEAARLDSAEFSQEDRQHLNMSRKEIWLVSKDNTTTGGVAGRVVTAFPLTAAKWLKDGTHALASESQIAAHKAELAMRKEEIEKAEADRKGVPTSKILQLLVDNLAQQPTGENQGGQRRISPK